MKEIELYKNCRSKCCSAKIVRGQPDTWKLMCSDCCKYCEVKEKKNKDGMEV